MKLDNGIPEADRKQIAEGLARFLADTYTLYLKTHGFHWNVVGPLFASLHSLFEEQYNELWTATDLIAERIRALGFLAPGSAEDMRKLSSVHDTAGAPAAEEMLRLLVEGHEQVSKTARALVPLLEQANDEATLDLVTERLKAHEKTAWMLRSHLEGSAEVGHDRLAVSF